MGNLEYLVNNLDEKINILRFINEKILNSIHIFKDENDNYITQNLQILLDRYDNYYKFIIFYENEIVHHITNYYILKKTHNMNELKKNSSFSDLRKNNAFVKLYLQNSSKKIDLTSIYKKIYENFNNFLSTYDIYGNLDNYFYYIEYFVNYYFNNQTGKIKSNYILLQKLFEKYKKTITEYSISKINFDICKCGSKMIIRPNTSEILCINCGTIKPLIGDIFENQHFYSQEGNRYLHGSYIPSRHCRYWIDRIQAKENTIIDKEYINKIERCIQRDGIKNKKHISIKQYRSYLKETKLSELNDHIPLIRKHITGISPPQLTHKELTQLFNYFDKAVKAYNIIKPKNKKNSLYYPYMILKILEMIIDDSKKKRELISCIHLQGNKTLINNDKNWKLVCHHFNEFNFKPTDRNEYE